MYYFAKIKIGGNIINSQLDDMYQIIEDKHQEIFNLDGMRIPEDMKESFNREIELSIKTTDLIVFESDNARWGEYAYLQEYLEDNKIPYILESGPYYDIPERVKVFNPENNQDASQMLVNGEEVLMKTDVYEVIEMLKTGQNESALKRLSYMCEEFNSEIPNAKLI
jgi:hypothetical protein